MLFRDKEVIEKLDGIDKKISSLVAMHKADKIKKASKTSKKGGND